MPDFKMSIIFNAQNGGWTENWFISAADFRDAKRKVDMYTDARAKMLSQGAYIDAWRTSLVDRPNVTDYGTVDPALTQTRRYQDLRDDIRATLIIRLQGDVGGRRMQHISGIPDRYLFYDPDAAKMRIDNSLFDRAQTFVIAIAAIPVRLRIILKDEGSVNKREVVSAASQGDGSATITIPGHGYAELDRVRINKVTSVARPYITGTWRIYDVTTNTFKINGDLHQAFLAGDGGFVYRQRVGYSNVVSGTPIGVGNRKRGRPTGELHGRRRAR